MSALTERITQDHTYSQITETCRCFGQSNHRDYGTHISEVTEAAVRRQIEASIKAERDNAPLTRNDQYLNGLDDAADIVRNETTP